MAGTPGRCCLVPFTWAFECQAQTPHVEAGSWGAVAPCPVWLTSLPRPRLPQWLQRGSGPQASPVPADSAPGRLAQGWGSRDKWALGNRDQTAGRAPHQKASPGSAAPVGLGFTRSWALGAAPTPTGGSRCPSSPAPEPGARRCGALTRSPVLTQLILPSRRINICVEAEVAPQSGSFLVGERLRQREQAHRPWSESCPSPVACVRCSFISQSHTRPRSCQEG